MGNRDRTYYPWSGPIRGAYNGWFSLVRLISQHNSVAAQENDSSVKAGVLWDGKEGGNVKRAIMMDAKDNVATALISLKMGDTVMVVSSSNNKVCEIRVTKAIPFGHKVAIMAISKGGEVIKYGEVIGCASQDIAPGDYVHIHNVASNRMQIPEVWYRKEL